MDAAYLGRKSYERGDVATAAGQRGAGGPVASTPCAGIRHQAPRYGGTFDNLPGLFEVPTPADTSFEGWMKRITPTSSKPAPWGFVQYYGNTPKFAPAF